MAGALLLAAWLGSSVGAKRVEATAHRPQPAPTSPSPVAATPLATRTVLGPKFLAWQSPTLPFALGEASGVLWDMNTHRLLWELNPHAIGPIASTTKLLTIYLILHGGPPLTQTVTIDAMAAGTSGSDIKMTVGAKFTVKQLLQGLMLASANDAAVALAEADAGSVSAFVQKMNQTAAQLGLSDMHFVDPDGLARGSVGSAWDLAELTQLDMQYPLFRQIVSTEHTAIPENPQLWNLNHLLYMDPSIIGVKTGWTTAAGFNVVFAATRTVNGKPVTLLGVLLHGKSGFPPVYQDAEQLLKWGYSQVQQSP